jgi:HK97 family phage major capsid protein
MAVTAATKLSDFSGFLNRVQAGPIFQKAAQQSVVQRLAREVPLGANGVSIPVVTGKPTAAWVAEGATKPASTGAMTLKTMDPKKLAAIVITSQEVVRANPGGFMDQLRPQIGEAFALSFDAAALHGTSTPFTTYIDQTTNNVEMTGTTPATTAVWSDLNSALSLLVSNGKDATGWAFDSRFEPILNGTVDSSNRPLFIESPVTETAGPIRAGRLMGRDAFVGPGVYAATPKIYGYLGDWSQAAWGVVGGINYAVSTETAVTINGALVSLWENNLVAVRAEAEYGFLVNDTASFVKIANVA